MSERQSGLDVLRCLALLFVVTFHSFLNNGYYYEPQKGYAMWLAGSFRWLSVSCIGLFLLLTGYLKSEQTEIGRCWRGLFPVLAGYLLAAVISIPVRHFLLGDRQTLGMWITALFGFRGVYYGWYVEMYVGLMLLTPFLNRLLLLLDTKGLLLFAGTLLVMTALPGATSLVILPDYWRSFYPVTYYVLGTMIRRLQPKIHPAVTLCGATAMALLLGTATVLSTDGQLSESAVWEFPDIWVTVISVLLFLSFYRWKLPAWAAKLAAWGAGGCYGGYLLSYLLDAWCYQLAPQWKNPQGYGKLFFLITVPIFLVSVVAGRLLEKIIPGRIQRKVVVR